MKRLFLLIFPLILLRAVVLASFPNTWHEVFFSGSGFVNNQPPNAMYCTFYLSGDTTISDMTYQKLYIDGDYPGQTGTLSNKYVASLRTTSDGQKVYINTNNEEYLLFDFSVNVGDTCHAYFGVDAIFDQFTDKEVVKDLLVLSKGDYNGYPSIVLKMLNAPDAWLYRTTWIEGVGSTIGLTSFPSEISGVTTPVLLCASQDEQQLYMAPDESVSAWGYKNACPLVEAVGADILPVVADEFSATTPCYTILGTLAGEDYNGIVIQNGKVFIKQ